MDALSRANEVRARRAQLKRDLKSGRVSLAALMVDPPPYLETAEVLEMLLALPGHIVRLIERRLWKQHSDLRW